MSEIKKGDRVRKIGNSREMKVHSIKWSRTLCVWDNDGHVTFGHFNVKDLEKVEDQ